VQPYVFHVDYDKEGSRNIAGEFLYYLSGPSQITLRFDSVTQPGNQAGATHNIPIKPGDAFRLRPGHEFQTVHVKNRTNTGETRIEILAGFGDYIMGPEPIEIQVSEPRLDYMAHQNDTQALLSDLGIYLANHFDSAKTVFITDIQVIDQDITLNTSVEDWLYLFSGRNGTTASSVDDDELGEHDGETCTNMAAAGPYRRSPMDHRFSWTLTSAGQVGACKYTNGINPRAAGAKWQSGLEQGTIGLAHLTNDKPSLPTPLVLPPGYTATVRCSNPTTGGRKSAAVNFSWYEMAVGT